MQIPEFFFAFCSHIVSDFLSDGSTKHHNKMLLPVRMLDKSSRRTLWGAIKNEWTAFFYLAIYALQMKFICRRAWIFSLFVVSLHSISERNQHKTVNG